MGWSHILIEGHCFYDNEISKLPKCCKFGPSNLSLNCLNYDIENKKYCPFLAFGSARSTKVLTDERSVVIDFDLFEKFEVSQKEYLDLEKKWLIDNKIT